MRKIYRAFKVYQKQNLSGIQFIREAVEWFNDRPEWENENRGPVRLLMDYSDHVLKTTKELSED